MKILKVSFLSLIFFFQSAGPVADFCCQLLKVPELVEHFKEQSAETGISFLEFIDTHYGNQESPKNHENDRHDGDLPLQGHHSCSHGISSLNSEDVDLLSLEISEAKRTNGFYQPPFSLANLGSIFQPPKV